MNYRLTLLFLFLLFGTFSQNEVAKCIKSYNSNTKNYSIDSFNDKGQILKSLIYVVDDDTMQFTQYFYDSLSRLNSWVTLMSYGKKINRQKTYEYHNDSTITITELNDDQIIKSEVIPNFDLVNDHQLPIYDQKGNKIHYHYDTSNNVILEYHISNLGDTISSSNYEYNSKNQVIYEKYYSGHDFEYHVDYSYNETGLLEARIDKDSEGNIYETEFYQYDDSGVLIKEHGVILMDEHGYYSVVYTEIECPEIKLKKELELQKEKDRNIKFILGKWELSNVFVAQVIGAPSVSLEVYNEELFNENLIQISFSPSGTYETSNGKTGNYRFGVTSKKHNYFQQEIYINNKLYSYEQEKEDELILVRQFDENNRYSFVFKRIN